MTMQQFYLGNDMIFISSTVKPTVSEQPWWEKQETLGHINIKKARKITLPTPNISELTKSLLTHIHTLV